MAAAGEGQRLKQAALRIVAAEQSRAAAGPRLAMAELHWATAGAELGAAAPQASSAPARCRLGQGLARVPLQAARWRCPARRFRSAGALPKPADPASATDQAEPCARARKWRRACRVSNWAARRRRAPEADSNQPCGVLTISEGCPSTLKRLSVVNRGRDYARGSCRRAPGSLKAARPAPRSTPPRGARI